MGKAAAAGGEGGGALQRSRARAWILRKCACMPVRAHTHKHTYEYGSKEGRVSFGACAELTHELQHERRARVHARARRSCWHNEVTGDRGTTFP